MASAPLLATKLHIPPLRKQSIHRLRLLEMLVLQPETALILVSAPAGFGKTTLLSDWAYRVSGLKLHVEGEAWPSEAQPSTFNLQPAAVAWLSLDEGDNDPVRFFAYFIASLEQALGTLVDLRPAREALQAMPAGDYTAGMIFVSNELARLAQEFVVILDDYHQIHAPAVHSAVAYLVERLPAGCHVALGSRSTPPLPLSRLRARGQLIELRAADLRFNAQESAAFLTRTIGLKLDEAQMARLSEKCEGWAAGLQLAALAVHARLSQRQSIKLEGQASSESEELWDLIGTTQTPSRPILNYLMDEVFSLQPEPIQEFLLKTCLLERMTASLCAMVVMAERIGERRSGEDISPDPLPPIPLVSHAQSILEYLESHNLFALPLDEHGQWYRYHRLFAGALQARLERMHPEWLPELHRRASRWFERSRLMPEAIRHALAIPDQELAARLLEHVVESLLAHGETASLMAWLAELPEDILQANPRLQLGKAWTLAIHGELPKLEEQLQAVEASLENISEGPERQVLQGQAAAMRAFLSLTQRDPAQTMQLAETALNLLPEQSLFWRGIAARVRGEATLRTGDIAAASQAIAQSSEISLSAGDLAQGLSALYQLGSIQSALGHLQQAENIFREALERVAREGWHKHPYAGSLHAGLGSLLLEFNQLEEAQAHLQQALELGQLGGVKAVMLSALSFLARLKMAQNNLPAALALLEEAETLLGLPAVPGAPSPINALKVRYDLISGDLERALVWAESNGLHDDDPDLQGRESEYLVLALVLLAQGHRDSDGASLARAGRLLERLLAAAQSMGITNMQIEIQTIQALVYSAGGQIGQAIQTLKQVLALAMAGGYLRLFLDHGQPMEELLQAVRPQVEGAMKEYVERVLGAFRETKDGASEVARRRTNEALSSSVVRPSLITRPASLARGPVSLVDPLTSRELEVLRLVARGASNQEIADRLVVSLATVKSHVNHIMSKLGAQNRTEAVVRGREIGLVQ